MIGPASRAMRFGSILRGQRVSTSLPLNPSGFIGGVQVGYNWLVGPGSLWAWKRTSRAADTEGARRPLRRRWPPISRSQHRSKSTATGLVPDRESGSCAAESLVLRNRRNSAYGQTETSFSAIATGFTLATCPARYSCTTGSSSSVRAGWAAGAGLEWMFLPHWSLTAEYLFVDFDPSATGTSCCGTFTANAPFRENVARAGVNWYFEPPIAPILTK